MPPSLLSAELRKLTDEEWQLRSEHSLTPENRSRDPFVLGVSRMVAAPEGQVFRGDYVTVKFWLIYAVIGLLAAGAVLVCGWCGDSLTRRRATLADVAAADRHWNGRVL